MKRALALVVLVVGCFPQQKYLQTGNITRPSRPPTQVELFFDLVPARKARVLGLVAVTNCFPEQCLSMLREKGGEIGADAVVGIHEVRGPSLRGNAVIWDESGDLLQAQGSILDEESSTMPRRATHSSGGPR